MEIWVNIITPLLGIAIGIATTWYFKGRKHITINRVSSTLVNNDGEYSKLKYYYDNNEVQKLICTKLIIKNIGNTAIYKKDIKKFNITFNDSDFIEPILSYENENNVQINKLSNREIGLTFEFLDKKDIIEITILHNDNDIPKIKHKIISTKLSIIKDKAKMNIENARFLLMWIFSITILIYSIFVVFNLKTTNARMQKNINNINYKLYEYYMDIKYDEIINLIDDDIIIKIKKNINDINRNCYANASIDDNTEIYITYNEKTKKILYFGFKIKDNISEEFLVFFKSISNLLNIDYTYVLSQINNISNSESKILELDYQILCKYSRTKDNELYVELFKSPNIYSEETP